MDLTLDRVVGSVFAAAILAQLFLGSYRARAHGESVMPALTLAGLLAIVGVLWFLRRRQLPGAFLAQPAALILGAIGAMSGFSALHAPLLDFISRFSTPFLAFSMAVMLMVAELSPRAHIIPVAMFILAVAGIEIALT